MPVCSQSFDLSSVCTCHEDGCCDAIVTLGARILSDGTCGPAAARRVRKAVQAYRNGVAPMIVFAGGTRWNGFIEAVQMAHYAWQLGVGHCAMQLETFSRRTFENALYCKELAKLLHWQHLALVTCDWHMPRAVKNFHRCGVNVVPIAAHAPSDLVLQKQLRVVREHISLWSDALRQHMQFTRL